jgi:hypothetical protein
MPIENKIGAHTIVTRSSAQLPCIHLNAFPTIKCIPRVQALRKVRDTPHRFMMDQLLNDRADHNAGTEKHVTPRPLSCCVHCAPGDRQNASTFPLPAAKPSAQESCGQQGAHSQHDQQTDSLLVRASAARPLPTQYRPASAFSPPKQDSRCRPVQDAHT